VSVSADATLAGLALLAGLAILFVTLVAVGDRRRFRMLVAIGLALVAGSFVLMVALMGFGPDLAARG
jgi:hypothetical protein